MFKSRTRSFKHAPNCDENGVYRVTRSIGGKNSKVPLRRFDCFDPEDDDLISTEEEIFINEISQKICLLSLQVSRIENRLSAFETQPMDDFRKPLELRDPPNCQPTIPIRRKKKIKKNQQQTTTKTTIISHRTTQRI